MNNETFPITLPPELVRRWYEAADNQLSPYYVYMAHQAARWGADQELEACCEILRGEFNYHHLAEPLRAARRPKPLSLKEQSLALIDKIQSSKEAWDISDLNVVRRALESLPS